jgi:hypothetical protein
MLRLAARALGRSEEYLRLSEPLVVSTASLERLGWSPVVHTKEGLARFAQLQQRTA